jgi:hypothetical protein
LEYLRRSRVIGRSQARGHVPAALEAAPPWSAAAREFAAVR